MSFKTLLETLQNLDANQGETLAKSLQPAQDDKKIQAAAKEGEAAGAGDGNGDGAGAGDGEGEGEGEGKPKEGEGEGEGDPLAKSQPLLGANGEEMVDATEMLETLQKSMNDSTELLGTALPTIIAMMERMGNTIVSQGEMIKSLQLGQVSAGAQGAGRKSQLVLMAKSQAGADVIAQGQGQEQQLTGGELMIKSNAAYAAGKINGVQLGMVDLALRNNAMPPADVLSIVMGESL